MTQIGLVIPAKAEILDEVLTDDKYVAVQVTWQVYQQIIAAFDEPVARDGKRQLFSLLKGIRSAPAGRAGRVGDTGADVVAQSLTDPGLLRLRGDQRSGRGDQRQAGAPTGYRVGVQEQGALHLAVVDSLSWVALCNRCTLKAEGLVNSGTRRKLPNWRIHCFLTGRTSAPTGATTRRGSAWSSRCQPELTRWRQCAV